MRPPIPYDAVPLKSFLDTLPQSLRSTALLALTGHTRIEIAYLLRLSNPALRQRISQIRTRWRTNGGAALDVPPGPTGTLQYGLIRRALKFPLRHLSADVASHDPDGHLFCVKMLTNEGAAATYKTRNT